MALPRYLPRWVAVAWMVVTPAFAADQPVLPWLSPPTEKPAPLPDWAPTSPSGPTYRVQQVAAPEYTVSALTPPSSLILKGPNAPAPPAWSWTGFYVGAHVGAAVGTANFADPFGSSIFGNEVTAPGFLAGGQIGFNWQAPNSPWVFGVQADISGLASEGTNTCFAYSGSAINTTCRVRPEATGTFTGRIGYAAGPDGRTLLYLKGGLAWGDSRIDMALNNDMAGVVGPAITSNSTNVGLRGGTVGAGAEYALTPAWSLFAEYDYLGFGSTNVANLGSVTVSPFGVITGVVPPGLSGVTQNIQEFKLGLNYKLGADPWAPGLDRPLGDPHPVEPRYLWSPVPGWGPGWELETGARYMYSWGQFHKDLGKSVTSGSPTISSISRLTYDDMQTNSGEFFARLDTPWNFFVKGFVGGGWTNSGHMNDEDFGIPLLGTYAPYSNTLSSLVTGNTFYGVVDGGYDFLHGSSYKVGGFVGYFHFDEKMNAFGCAPIANINCIPNVPTTGAPIITETDHWDGLRIGVASEVMLTPRVKLSGDVAYLPYVSFNGVDNHFFGNSGVLASINPETGHGQGVQFEGALSYYFTPTFSVGVGGRYWGLWTTSAQANRTFDATGGTVPSPPQFFRATTEQAGAFVQATFKFGVPASVAAKN